MPLLATIDSAGGLRVGYRPRRFFPDAAPTLLAKAAPVIAPYMETCLGYTAGCGAENGRRR
ncbi:hypothetical protein PYJP_12130 [Pyrofollis japonicus]|nr:hypothetical protein PYJP_12130 [Pyrofollis japonicus]